MSARLLFQGCLKFIIITNIVDRDNYKQALKWLDYIVIDEDKISGKLIGKISERLRVPQKDLMNLISKGPSDLSKAGITAGQGI